MASEDSARARMVAAAAVAEVAVEVVAVAMKFQCVDGPENLEAT
jgi:hypothetical protein